MITKNIFKYLAAGLLCCGLATAFTSCSSEEDPYFTADENDAPRILNTDIPEGEEGKPGVIATIERAQNFEFELIVTPVHYTTITWFIDDEQVAEGLKINVPVIAGDHILKIVATTTKGLSTSRTCKLVVRPSEGDPQLADDAKSRWLTIGATKTVECSNVTSVAKVFIGKKEATGVAYADGKLTFTVPTLDEGEYQLVIETTQGVRFGCGVFTVSKEEYVDPGIKETVLWQGDQVMGWDAELVKITADQMAAIPVGSEIHIYYTTPEAEYHAMRITSPWWGDNPEDDYVNQFDLTTETPNPFVFVYDEHCKALVEERGAICLVGFGYNVQKVVAVEGVAPAENILWEGDVVIDWNADLCKISGEQMAEVPVGATVQVHYELVEAEYHAMRITSPWWGDNPEDDYVNQFDVTEETPNPFEFTYDEHCKALVEERGAICLVGFGYKVTKVTYKK